MPKSNHLKVIDGLIGVCIGDALGVPVEFTSRQERTINPITKMQGYGTYNQPPGTWSDDSSLTFCLAEALTQELLTDKLYETLANYFCKWQQKAYWTPHRFVFDIGITTRMAILRLTQGVSPIKAGKTGEMSNGNGSLMRILPLAFCYQLVKFPSLIKHVHNVSCLTHGHPRSQIACGIYISIAVSLLEGNEPLKAYSEGITRVSDIYQQEPYRSEMQHFQRVMSGKIIDLPIDNINSSGYVIDTLEAALWCFLNNNNYADAVLNAVNLGGDTDTTAAVTGGLAGIYYGIEQIPQEWIDQIARKDDIIDLGKRLETAINKKKSALKTLIEKIKLLEHLGITQNQSSQAIKKGSLSQAHSYLKATTIKIFENAGDDKILNLETAVQLFLIFFRAGFYLEDKSGDFAYRYEAIPGQLGNACYYQLGLSQQDASGYNPEPNAVKECASAAHELLYKFAKTIIIQTISQRERKIAVSYPKEDIEFSYNNSGYPIVKVINHSRSEQLDFSQPRYFDFSKFKQTLKSHKYQLFSEQLDLLKIVEDNMDN